MAEETVKETSAYEIDPDKINLLLTDLYNFISTTPRCYKNLSKFNGDKTNSRDMEGGKHLCTELLNKISISNVNNIEIANCLRKINNMNAYDFFYNYKISKNGQFDLITKILTSSVDKKNILHIRNILVPIKSLLMQAKTFGLENQPCYKNLEQRHRELTKLLTAASDEIPASRVVAKDLDSSVNALIKAIEIKLST